jgi:hypothetical protein
VRSGLRNLFEPFAEKSSNDRFAVLFHVYLYTHFALGTQVNLRKMMCMAAVGIKVPVRLCAGPAINGSWRRGAERLAPGPVAL